MLFQTGESKEPFVLVKKDGINYKIYCKDILYLYAIPRGVCLVLTKETMKVPYLSIKQIMEKLPEGQFVQCHRMYVVNRSFIDYVDIVNRIIRMKNLQEVEIGVTYKTEIRGLLHV